MTKSPKQICEEWITALRSEEYPQGGLCLRDENCYCLFGVLADVLLKASGKKWEWNENRRVYEAFGCGFAVAKEHRELLKMSLGERDFLTIQNDSGKMPFADAADWIEQNISGRLG